MVRLGRPHFLVGGAVLYGLGAAVAGLAGESFDWTLHLWGQGAVTAFQLMTHYVNDYFDYEADRANTTPTRFSGGSRVLAADELPRRWALVVAIALGVLALGVTAGLMARMKVEAFTGVLLLLTGFLSWEYSAPPLRLHSTGWGAVTVAVVVTGLVPAIGFSLQSPALIGGWVLLAAITPLMLLQFAMVLAIDFPDAAGDRIAGKRTLVVRWGARPVARLYQAALLLAYGSLPVLFFFGSLPGRAAALAALTAPIALWRVARMQAGDFDRKEKWEAVAFWSVALLIVTSTAMLIGCLPIW